MLVGLGVHTPCDGVKGTAWQDGMAWTTHYGLPSLRLMCSSAVAAAVAAQPQGCRAALTGV